MNRDTSVDILKGWNILTIVLLHISSTLYNQYSNNFFGFPWSVPIFFVISGFFLKESSLKDSRTFLKKKFHSLYVPTTIYYLLAVLLHNCFIYFDWYKLGDLHPGNGIPFYNYGISDILIKSIKVFLCAGSGELIMGAMWFIYTLIYAMIAFVILEKFIFGRIKKDKIQVQFVFLLALQFISCFLSQKMGFTISRVNICVTALFLIYLGALIHQKFKFQFNNIYALTVSIILFVNVVLFQTTEVRLALNQYQDVLQLCVGSLSLLYIQGFIAKKIQTSIIGKTLAFLGVNSLHIMALHILGYMICNSVLVKLGVFNSDSAHGMYTFDTSSTIWIYLCYVLSGVITPLIIISIFRFTKKKLMPNTLLTTNQSQQAHSPKQNT